MWHIHVYIVDVIFVLPFIFGVEGAMKKMKCYQCEVTDLSLCTDKYLLPCPDDQAYDTCMTRISRTKSDGFWIHKSCALGPCSLRDESQSSGLGLDYCDRSKEEFDCVTCCRQEGCNTGGGASIVSQKILIFLLALIIPLSKRNIHI